MPLRMVVAAREPLDRAFRDSGKVSPFENLCTQEEIGIWDGVMIREFVVERLRGNSVQFSQGEIDRVVRESGGVPGKVMEQCFELYRVCQGKG